MDNAPARHLDGSLPVCLTISGSESTGGSLVQADLKTFTALGTYGVAVVTSLQARSFARLRGELPVPESFVREQLEAADEALAIGAVKVGLCPTPGIIRVVGRWLRQHPGIPMVLDPVIVQRSGIPMQQPEVITAMREELLPRATVATPNRVEAALLTGLDECLNRADMERAAQRLFGDYGCPTVVCGGGTGDEVLDVFCGMDGMCVFPAPAVRRSLPPHGAGDTYSSALTALIARGNSLREAMLAAKHYVRALLADSPNIAKPPPVTIPLCQCLAVDTLAQADGVGISAHGTQSYRREPGARTTGIYKG